MAKKSDKRTRANLINKADKKDTRHEDAVLHGYIEYARRSALPPRLIFLFLHLTCAAAFFAYWNALEGSWTSARVREYRNAINWLGQQPPSQDAPKDVLETYNSAKKTYEYFGIEDETHLEDVLKKKFSFLEESFNDDIRIVRVPVIGVKFDVNDLGLFSGFIFVVGLTMYRFSLVREQENIELAYLEARRMDCKDNDREEEFVHRKLCYELISMNQLIVSPPVRGKVEWYWLHAPKVGLFLPFIIQLCILANDLSTMDSGFTLSQVRTVCVLMISFTAVLWILFLTVHSFFVWLRLERFWQREGRRLGFIPKPDPLIGPNPDDEKFLEKT